MTWQGDVLTFSHIGVAKDLETEEAKLRAGMDKAVNNAVKNKKLVLFDEMLQFYNYPDKGAVRERVDGATLVGEVEMTHMLPLKFCSSTLDSGCAPESGLHEKASLGTGLSGLWRPGHRFGGLETNFRGARQRVAGWSFE